ncbi:MAG: hypothetical protein ACR2N2_04530 [Acidimicrobiia bacterium]
MAEWVSRRSGLLLVGAVDHVAQTLFYSIGVVMVGASTEDGLHAVVDRLVVLAVDPTFVGVGSLEQLHGRVIG